MGVSVPPKAIREYHDAVAELRGHGVENEMGLRGPFQALLQTIGAKAGWTLVPERALPNGARPDGTFLDGNHFERGYWEAKDSKDDLEAEIRAKTERGYPRRNTIFEDGSQAVLYQDDQRVLEVDLASDRALREMLLRFFDHTSAEIANFSRAVDEFATRIPDLAGSIMAGVERERRDNAPFRTAFGAFHELCRQSLDPNLQPAAVEEMLVQHLLTERLFRTVFQNPDFTRRNVIAAEIEKVIDALTGRAFSRDAYQQQTDHFYRAIEERARAITEWSEKQHFLNTVYERFFQGFSPRQADTHGIVYTPQEIVDFMCASVDAVLQDSFGKSLSSPGVCILDPCVGTGNFIVNILGLIQPQDLRRKYTQELFCNEIMLLPYYIASLNIEHRYFELTGEYLPFEGLCFADSLDMAEPEQLSLFTERNTERVAREKAAEITVVIGNPPYNVGQMRENDANKNRRYPVIDQRIRETYARDSRASSTSKLRDAYVRFFRWATDRLKPRPGIICFVSNNSFVDQVTFDGMRRHLAQEFTVIRHLDLHGNVRRNPRLSGTKHNVFGIQVGVGITLAERSPRPCPPSFRYLRVPDDWRREEKLRLLAEAGDIRGCTFEVHELDAAGHWSADGAADAYAAMAPLSTREARSRGAAQTDSVFADHTLGLCTHRDSFLYGFDHGGVIARARSMSQVYNSEVDRWRRDSHPGMNPDSFVRYDDRVLAWSRDLKQDLTRGRLSEFEPTKAQPALYRPFCAKFVYFDSVLNEEVYGLPRVFPSVTDPPANWLIAVSDHGHRAAFSTMVADEIPDLHVLAASDGFQCFPLYTYDEDGTNRRDNITDWALEQFQEAYGPEVTRRNIFDYTYAILHHPVYRERYAENLKRELPRIPLVPGAERFGAFVAAGARLCELHLGYESVDEYPLDWRWTPGVPLNWRVERMKLSKDRTAVIVNEALTLAGVPEACFDYRLGNRSALEWVIDQYRAKTDKRSGIVSDPNRADEPEYIVRLVGRVIAVSLETVAIVNGLPALD